MTPSKAPWTKYDVAVHDADDRLVAICYGGTPQETEANAWLMSLAPEMLKVLEKILEDNPPMEGRDNCPISSGL